MKVRALGILLLFALPAGFVGASANDYAGTWVLNKEKSTGDLEKPATKLVVTVDKKRFKVDYVKTGEKPERSEYKLDGKPVESKRDEKLFVIKVRDSLKQIENGEVLELTSYLEFEGKNLGGGTTVTISTPPQTYRKVWKLQEEGKVLLITYDDGQSLVYDKE